MLFKFMTEKLRVTPEVRKNENFAEQLIALKEQIGTIKKTYAQQLGELQRLIQQQRPGVIENYQQLDDQISEYRNLRAKYYQQSGNTDILEPSISLDLQNLKSAVSSNEERVVKRNHYHQYVFLASLPQELIVDIELAEQHIRTIYKKNQKQFINYVQKSLIILEEALKSLSSVGEVAK
jgi:hypothetical protein